MASTGASTAGSLSATMPSREPVDVTEELGDLPDDATDETADAPGERADTHDH
jgi:hypothetical protein